MLNVRVICLFFLLGVVAVPFSSAERIAIPVADVRTASASDPVGLLFSLPDSLQETTISRATLVFTTDCEDSTLLCVRALEDGQLWEEPSLTQSIEVDPTTQKGTRILSAFNCNEQTARVDVTKWVRSWVDESNVNYGLVVETVEGGIPKNVDAPMLYITFLNRTLNSR